MGGNRKQEGEWGKWRERGDGRRGAGGGEGVRRMRDERELGEIMLVMKV